MFSGCYVHGVDEKNRISIPARFRRQLSGRFVLTKGPDGCIWALPADEWQVIVRKARSSVHIERFFLASSAQCVLGARGRCLLPDNLRQHADIKPGDLVTIVGLGARIEIWNSHRWDAACSQITGERARQELPEFYDML